MTILLILPSLRVVALKVMDPSVRSSPDGRHKVAADDGAPGSFPYAASAQRRWIAATS